MSSNNGTHSVVADKLLAAPHTRPLDHEGKPISVGNTVLVDGKHGEVIEILENGECVVALVSIFRVDPRRMMVQTQ